MRYLVVATLVLAAACGGTASSTTAPDGGAASGGGCGTKANFILANPGGLTCLDDKASATGKIVKLPDQSAPSTPALHPSGQAFAFALTQQPDPKRGFGSDIYMVNLDGSNLHPIVLHEDNNVFYASPRFDASGNVLYVHRRAAIIQNGSFVGNSDNIVRIDLRSGESKKIITDGADPTISSDGKSIVYVHLKESQIDGIWRADIDGTSPAPLLRTKDSWWYLQAPRFSPAGCQLAFSGAGHTVGLGSSGGKLAHLNIPSEIFIVPCDGASVKSIGQTGDDVVPAWSPDGSKIAYVGSGGFFVLDMKTQQIRTIANGQDFFFGDLVWLR